MSPYSSTIEQGMKEYFESLSEKDRRRYAGVEALKFERGGVSYIASLFGIARKTVRKGMKEVNNLAKAEKKTDG